jgi:hypothetical protein
MSEDCRKVVLGPDAFDPLEQTLASLAPLAPMKSRNQLLFEAGRASTREPYLLVWQCAAVGFGMLSLLLGLFLLWPREPEVMERERIVIQYRDREPQSTTSMSDLESVSQPLSPTISAFAVSTEEDTSAEETRKMLRMRNEVLRFGVEMLPRPNATKSQPAGSSPSGTTLETEVIDSLYLPRGIYASPFRSLPTTRPEQREE